MRALDSTTALSMAALHDGLPPGERRERLLYGADAPEFAHAAGIDTAFWTAQNLLFANAGRFLDGLPLAAFVSGTELAPYATYETAPTTARCSTACSPTCRGCASRTWRSRSSRTRTSRTSSTMHDLPFSSAQRLAADGPASARRRSATGTRIHRQDKLLARFLAALRARPDGARTVVVFLSDHGEQLGEHGLHRATPGPCTTRRSASRCGSTRRRAR